MAQKETPRQLRTRVKRIQDLLHKAYPDPKVAVGDIERLALQVLDPVAREGGFAHDRIDNNARAHLTSILLGHQTTLAVHGGEPALGTWQSVFLIELDGPCTRSLYEQVLGE